MRSSSLAPVVALAVLHAGCASIQHATPPVLGPESSGADACRFSRTLFVLPARADVRLAQGSNVSWGFGQSDWYSRMTVGSGSSGLSGVGADGVDFYLGDARLAPRDGLLRLDDAELVARYDATLERYSMGRHAVWARPLWITLLTGGLATMGLGIGAMMSAEIDPVTDAPDYGTSLALLSASAGAMLVSLPFLWLDLAHQQEAAELSIRSSIFVPDDQPVADRVSTLVDAHNSRAAAATCE